MPWLVQPAAEPGVFGGVGRGRLGQQLPGLRQRPVRLLRRVARQLGAIQAEQAQRHHALGGQQPRHLAEQPAQRRLVPGPEPGDGGMIGRSPPAISRQATSRTHRFWITRLDRSPWQQAYSSSATIISGPDAARP